MPGLEATPRPHPSSPTLWQVFYFPISHHSVVKDDGDGGHKGLEGGKRLEKYEELRQLGCLWLPFHLNHPLEWVSLVSLKGVLISLVKAPSATEPGTFLATLRSTEQQAIPYQVISHSCSNL